MQQIGKVETLAQAIAAFETVGMPAKNLAVRTRREYANDLHFLATFLAERGITRLNQGGLRELENSYSAESPSEAFQCYVLLPKHDDPVEAVLSNGTNPALSERIRIGSPHGRPDDPDILRCEDRIEAPRELRITIMDQEPHGQCAVLDLPTEVASLLSHPRARRARGTPSQMHAATATFDEKQNIYRL